jgi:acyl carrier protein
MNMSETNADADQVSRRIREFIARQFLHGRAELVPSDEASLFADGIVDSVGILQLVNFVESDFKISVEPGDLVLENFESINALKQLVLRKT